MSSGILEILVFAVTGGLIRGGLGLSKYYVSTAPKKRKIKPEFLISTLLASAAMGVLAGSFIEEGSSILAFLTGYAGTDIIEGLIRISWKRKDFVN
jgi:hypothetical protein